MQDRAPPLTCRNQRRLARRDKGGDTMKRSATIFDAFQGCQQLVVVGLVAGTIGVASRVHTGCTAERIDRKPRVVRDRRQARGICRVLRLEQRIFCKGHAGLVGVADAKLGLRDDVDTQPFEQAGDLPDLARVARCHNDLLGTPAHDCAALIASFWASMIAPIPALARSSIAVSSSPVNAWPSAVPCTSMKCPASFMTTFISVSASESST